MSFTPKHKDKSSSGLRILWIPGRRKHNHKGHYDATNKQVSYTTQQKKSQVWSLGGSKAQRDLINADSNTALIDGPSVSGLGPVACTVGSVGVAQCATAVGSEKLALDNSASNIPRTPNTPNSSASTALLISVPNSPEPTTSEEAMPITMTAPNINITTAADIIDVNRFSLLDRDSTLHDSCDACELPSQSHLVPIGRDKDSKSTNSTSIGSTPTCTTPSIFPQSDDKSNTDYSTPIKKKLQRNHNNNQDDVNSIENASDNTNSLTTDREHIDGGIIDRNAKDHGKKTKHKKKKKAAKTRDQLDGITNKINNSTEESADDDEKIVKCLYYTLMCCECTIS